MTVSRRTFLKGAGITAGAVTAGFFGLRALWDRRPVFEIGYGPLVPDPEGILDLPEGFRYTAISKTGDRMDDGFLVPGGHDGMAAFAGPEGRVIVVRNHELSANALERSAFGLANEGRDKLDPSLIYDATGGFGGTTTLVYNTQTQQLERHFLSLIGTVRNCAGGRTPWNSWVSCEESTEKAGEEYAIEHGYNFEVPAGASTLVSPVPLKAMGRFNHEAVAVDAASGVVFQTEDRRDSLFYRFVPDEQRNLRAGRLQALRIVDREGVNTSNRETRTIVPRTPMPVAWIDLENVESPEDDLRMQGAAKGAAQFSRGEGIWAEPGSIYFACTSGGAAECGQIFRYSPVAETIELFVESPDASILQSPDNIAIAPWGDLLACEDGPKECRLIGITPDGTYYTFARNAMNDSELTGGVFSPDGSTLFVSLQTPGVTLAVTGPWKS